MSEFAPKEVRAELTLAFQLKQLETNISIVIKN